MVLNDVEIEKRNLITPFVPRKQKKIDGTNIKVPSFGLSSGGYDIRLSGKFGIRVDRSVVSPEHAGTWRTMEAEQDFRIPPHQTVIAGIYERIDVPEDVIVTVEGKSTYTRLGLLINCTPLEPGWRGHPTVTITNPTDYPIEVALGGGIAQLIFHQMTGKARVPYGEDGKYQDQGSEPVTARV